jgi:D-threonate/D-erythronate kinase
MAIVIIADDLSGAAELAGIAFARGLSAEVQRQFDPHSPAEVIAVDTDTRGLSEAAAAAKVEVTTQAVIASQPAWLYKKTDSVLRGHPAAEVAAAMTAAGLPRAVFVPANPSRGRTIAGGEYAVHGMPLDRTDFAQDPEFPRRSALVSELLGPAQGILLPDVTTFDDVRALARGVDAVTLPAGAADFFAALLDERTSRRQQTAAAPLTDKLQPPMLLVCGSRASWPRRRQALAAAGIAAIELDQTGGAGELSNQRCLALGIGEATAASASPEVLLSKLTQLAAVPVQRGSYRTVLAEGGATAAALANRMGWMQFRVAAEAPAGLGVLQPLGAGAPLLLVKPGSYDWPPEIWQRLASHP